MLIVVDWIVNIKVKWIMDTWWDLFGLSSCIALTLHAEDLQFETSQIYSNFSVTLIFTSQNVVSLVGGGYHVSTIVWIPCYTVGPPLQAVIQPNGYFHQTVDSCLLPCLVV